MTTSTGQEGRDSSKLRRQLLLDRIVATKLNNSSRRLGYLRVGNGDDDANEIGGAKTRAGKAEDGLLTNQGLDEFHVAGEVGEALEVDADLKDFKVKLTFKLSRRNL